MEQINPQDIKTHDRTLHRPPKPLNQNNQQEQQRLPRKNSALKRQNSATKKQSSIQSYQKSKKDSISTDVSSQKSVKTFQTQQSSTLTSKRGSSQNSKPINNLNKTFQNPSNVKKACPKKKKKTNKQKEKLEKQKLLDLEEQLQQQQEEERQQELIRFRYEQELMLSKEERARLEAEYGDEQAQIFEFEAKVYFKQQQKQIQRDWIDYLECATKPNPDKENTITQFLYIYNEKYPVENFDMEKILEMADYSEGVIRDLYTSYLIAKADNKTEKMSYCMNFINKIRNITHKKWGEMTAYIMKNQQKLVDEKNKTIEENQNNKLTPLIGDNLKQISTQVAQNQTLRQFYEMQVQYTSEMHKLGIWLNPLYKCGYRSRPVTFEKLGVSIECPRSFQNQLVIRCSYFQNDNLSRDIQQDYEVLGGFYDVNCFKFLPLPLVRSKFMMQREYNTVEEACQKLEYPQPGQQGEQFDLSCQFPLPTHIDINIDELIIGFYDEKLQKWVVNNDEIKITKVDTETNKVNISTKILKPIAFLKKKHTDFPYKSWFLRYNQPDECLLDITTKRGLTFKFEFTEYYIKLRRCNISILEPLFDQPFEISDLLCQMKDLGFNLLPDKNDITEQYKRDLDVENKTIQELIFNSPGFMMKSVNNTQEVQLLENINQRLLFQIRENLDYQTKDYDTDEFDWKIASIWCNKCGLIGNGQGKKLESQYKNTETHATIEKILYYHQVCASDQILQRITNQIYCQLQNNLRIFCKLTRMVLFT